jgi:uncharacterized membrane protein YdbT with pleckstrin-like domain
MSDRYSSIAGNRYEDEQQRLELRPAWRSYWKWYLAIIASFLFLADSELEEVGVIIAFILSVIVVILRFRYLFIVTSRRVISRVGLIARNTNEIEIRHTREYKVKQGIIERLLNYGDIEISSAASSGTEVVFSGIIAPQDLKEAIRTVRNGW